MFPVKAYLFDKEFVALIPMEIPFCDQSTLSGFLIANVMQGCYGFWACICTVIYGTCFITVIGSYTMGAELLAEDFRDLDEMWTGKIQVSVAYRHAFLRNICRKRQDMNWYKCC